MEKQFFTVSLGGHLWSLTLLFFHLQLSDCTGLAAFLFSTIGSAFGGEFAGMLLAFAGVYAMNL